MPQRAAAAVHARSGQVEVEWGRDEAGLYAVPLHVSFEDRPGMLAAITQTVDRRGRQHPELPDGRPTTAGIGGADLIVDIDGREHLDRIFAALRQLPGVTGVGSGPSSFARRASF